MAPLIEQEILYRLLTGPFGPRLRQMAMLETPTNRIAQAIAWLRQNFTQPLAHRGAGEPRRDEQSSLHHHFKAVTAMTPMQYQKQLRLHEARRLMLTEHLDVGTPATASDTRARRSSAANTAGSMACRRCGTSQQAASAS
jgi:transcriptional regulator GlxA family with amidase domain